jgi:hypothetical protein
MLLSSLMLLSSSLLPLLFLALALPHLSIVASLSCSWRLPAPPSLFKEHALDSVKIKTQTASELAKTVRLMV